MSIHNRIKKIAIYHNLPQGGGIRVVENITKKYLNKYQIDIIVIGEKKPNKINGVRTIFFNVNPWKGFVLRNLWIMLKLPKIHRQISTTINENYDFVFLNHDYFTKSPYLLRYIKIPNLYICHEAQREFYEPWKYHTQSFSNIIANILRYPIKIIDEINVKSTKSIICNSNFSKNKLEKIYNKKCDVVYPGVDEEFFKPINGHKKPFLLCVGGLNPVKDQIFLVKALSPILKKFELVLVGEGKSKYIKEIMTSAKVGSKIKILNRVSETELRNLYRNSLVTCITAHQEPFGLSSIESQSCGTPVVSVAEGGIMETVIENKTGYLTPRNEAKFLRNVILAIENNRRMSIDARKNAVLNWTWKKTLRKLDKYLK